MRGTGIRLMKNSEHTQEPKAKGPSLTATLVWAAVASVAVCLLVHFCIVMPLSGAFGYGPAQKMAVWLLYTVPSILAAFAWLFRSPVLCRHRRPARVALLFLLSCGLFMGAVVLLWLGIGASLYIYMSGHQGPL